MKRLKTNLALKKLITDLKDMGFKKGSPFLVEIAKRLEKPTRQMAEVNIGHIESFCKKDETILVPGKVLGTGELTKPVKIAAYKFSTEAKKKIEKVKGKVMTIRELVKSNPKGKKVRVFS